MYYHTIGTSSLRVSSIGMGCMSLGNGQADNTRLIHRAMDLGVNFFDTADLYDKGLNEKMVGRILKDRREQVVLSTKVGNQWRQDGSGWDWNPRKDYIIQAAEESLTRLGTDHLDLYLLHGGTLEDPIDETIEAFEQLQREGKIRYYGISSIRPKVIEEYMRRSHIVSVMTQYSLLDRRPEGNCLDMLKNAGIGVLARGVLAKGLLAGKSPVPYLEHTAEQVEKASAAIRSCSGQLRNLSRTALQFVLQHPAITTAVVGLRTIGQAEDILEMGKIPPLTGREIQFLRESS